MRVAVVLEQALAPIPGGTGRYSLELAAALARVPTSAVAGWTAWHGETSAATVPGVEGPHRMPLPRRALVAAWERRRGPAPTGAQLVHAPTPLFPPRRAVPVVVTVHDTVPWTHPETLTARGVAWHRRMIGRAADEADAITVPTRAVGDSLCEFLPALDPARLHVLGAGVAPALRCEPTPEMTARVSARLRLPDRYLLTLATLEPRKGLDVVIRALGRLGRAAPPLVVAGPPGWGDVDVPAAARAAGLTPDAVRVVGRLPDAELGVVLRRATVLAMPSRAEGFGLPVAEAMAVGTPVICSDVPALVEVAGGAAQLVPVGDDAALAEAIERVFADEERRIELARLGRQRSSAYDWDVVAERAWRLYEALTG